MKKPTKRSRSKFPGLDPSVNSKPRWELLDHDYLDKLTDKEKTWLSNFNEEYISGNFKHKGKKKFHKTPEERRACYTRNNARNRDIYSIYRTSGWINDPNVLEESIEKSQTKDQNAQEDALIELIDSKKS